MGENLPPIKLLNLTRGGDNPAGHCFALRDLIPINILKHVMIVKLKMCTTEKVLVKFLSKTIRDTFFPNMWSAIKRGDQGQMLMEI